MTIERLVTMANDIGHFFASEPDRGTAIAGIASHIRRFWEPRMRRALIAHAAQDGADLDDLVRAAVNTLRTLP